MKLPYEKYVGRVGRVISISKDNSIKVIEKYIIEFKLEDTGEIVIGESISNNLYGITPLWVIDEARKRYIGKTHWITGSVAYTSDESKEERGYFTVKRFSPVNVTDVVISDDQQAPVRVIFLSQDGKQGYVDVSLSNTNAEEMLTYYHQFSEMFLSDDPRTTYKWGERVWELIEKHEVVIGMTMQQVQFSFGKPTDIKTTKSSSGDSDMWIYGTARTGFFKYIHFTNGRVTVIQD